MNEQPDILNAIPELEGNLPAEQFMEPSLWLPVLLGLAALLLAGGAGLVLWLCLRKKPVPPPTQEELALKALDALQEELPPTRELSLRLSLILREFLTGQTQDPALFETHEEFTQRMDALGQVPQECRYDTRCLLENLADMKYSGQSGQDDFKARGLIEQARTIITRITIAQRKEAAEAAGKDKGKEPS